jgi:hypothetical protein
MDADWLGQLIVAVNADNRDPDCRCSGSATKALLKAAPEDFRGDADLALADFDTAGDHPLARLRSDGMATGFEVAPGSAASRLFVARMTVPGGPWPGHFGLECIAFDTFRAAFPDFFPALDAEFVLDFADTHGASDGFVRGQGSVLFPELLSLRRPLARQGFGIVFLDRLARLYRTRVEPVLHRLRVETSVATVDLRPTRQVAFLAHEWGHLTSPRYEQTVSIRRRRLFAVVEEIYADLSGLTMLLAAGSAQATGAAELLLLDRIGREAWLPRARAQVNSVAARHLLTVLRGTGYLVAGGTVWRLDVPAVAERLAAELALVRDIERACLDGDERPATGYLTGHGWRIEANSFEIDLDDDTSRRLRRAAIEVNRST